MSFVSLGGDGSVRPTFFELIAAEKLMPSLKSAAIYSLSVFAQRRSYLNRLLNYEDEISALLALLLDSQSLASGSASFADSLYGLRRAPFIRSQESHPIKPSWLSKRQQRLALLSLIVVPYIQVKLKKCHESLNSRGGEFRLPRPPSSLSQQDPSTHAERLLQRLQRLSQKCKRVVLLIFLGGFPYASCLWEAAVFIYQLLYLLNSSPFYSPMHHILHQHIVRVSGQEMAASEQMKVSRRQAQLRLANSHSSIRSVPQSLLLRAGHFVADHTRNALILSVFGFKLLEWWFLSAEQKVIQQKQLPIPPPPPSLSPHPDGLSLPKNESTCPLCRKQRTNPAMVISSGYVFCYPCIFHHVSRHGFCPVTRMPAGVDQLRRLYQSQ